MQFSLELLILYSYECLFQLDPRLIRPKPRIDVPGKGFQRCNGSQCKGKDCNYAHSREEQWAWNRQLDEERSEWRSYVNFKVKLLCVYRTLLPQASLSSFVGKFEFEMEVCLRKNLYLAIKQAIA